MCKCCGQWEDYFTYEGGTYAEQREEKRRQAAILAHHADVQHTLVLAGDPRGVFGEYPPAILGDQPGLDYAKQHREVCGDEKQRHLDRPSALPEVRGEDRTSVQISDDQQGRNGSRNQ